MHLPRGLTLKHAAPAEDRTDGQTRDDVIPADLKTFHGIFLSHGYEDLDAVVEDNNGVLNCFRLVNNFVVVVCRQLVIHEELGRILVPQ